MTVAGVIVVNTEAHFTLGPDGVIRSAAANAAYESWKTYLLAAPEVQVVARVSPSQHTAGHPVEGPGVKVVAIPGYSGLAGTITSLLRTYRSIRPALVRPRAVYLIRLPSIIGGLMIVGLKLQRRRFAVELIGDAFEVLRSGIVPRPLGFIGSYIFLLLTRWQVRGASLVNYVTGESLQRRYPPMASARICAISDVQLPPEAFAVGPRRAAPDSAGPFTAALIGTMSQPYKGHLVMIRALARLRHDGVECQLLLAGTGRLETEIRSMAEHLDVIDLIKFLGQIDTDQVRSILDDSDVFVLPSLTEGMPRALIEAMARGVPCVASRVGGIPEVIHDDFLVEAGNSHELAVAIARVLRDERRYISASQSQWSRAQDFSAERLSERRAEFCASLSTQVVGQN